MFIVSAARAKKKKCAEVPRTYESLKKEYYLTCYLISYTNKLT